jgi:copper chaperone CopZ
VRKTLLYGILGLGAFGTTWIGDLCTPTRISGLLNPRAAHAESVALARATPPASAQMVSARALPTAAAAEQLETVRLKVVGMTCGGCVISTRKVLTRLPGVTKADVSYEKGEALVTYDPGKVTIAQMVAAVKTLGYTATPVPKQSRNN